jgi:hypothetical protein
MPDEQRKPQPGVVVIEWVEAKGLAPEIADRRAGFGSFAVRCDPGLEPRRLRTLLEMAAADVEIPWRDSHRTAQSGAVEEAPDGSVRFKLTHRPGTAVHRARKEETMGRPAVVLYVLALAAVVVGVDVLFFRHQFWERLIVNVGIVLVFAAFYLRFLKRP